MSEIFDVVGCYPHQKSMRFDLGAEGLSNSTSSCTDANTPLRDLFCRQRKVAVFLSAISFSPVKSILLLRKLVD